MSALAIQPNPKLTPVQTQAILAVAQGTSYTVAATKASVQGWAVPTSVHTPREGQTIRDLAVKMDYDALRMSGALSRADDPTKFDTFSEPQQH